MRRPFDIQLFAIVERCLHIFANELVKYNTIIYTLNLYISAIEFAAAFRQLAWIDGIDIEQFFRRVEVGRCLLRRRIDVEQDDFFRVMISGDRPSRQIDKRAAIDSAVSDSRWVTTRSTPAQVARSGANGVQ